MTTNFDQIIQRSGTNSVKYDAFESDVQPLWVADADFAVAPQIYDAIRTRLEHPILGYTNDNPQLALTIQQRLKNLYKWEVELDAIFPIPGIVSGFNFACRAFCKPGQSVLFQTPAYPPFFEAPINNALHAVQSEMICDTTTGKYEIDFDEFESRIQKDTRMFILCNPQNPTGRVFTSEELTKLGEICEKHNLLICSDEIHCDLVYSGFKHTPIASISPELANRTITFIAPSKTFNIPGLACSIAIIQNKSLRKQYRQALNGLCFGVTCLSQVAGLAAYSTCEAWRQDLMHYLEGNRNFLTAFINREMPQVKLNQIEATFLAWLDCTALPIENSPAAFFLEKAHVGLNDGKTFGEDYSRFVRLNFATPRSGLESALEKMADAVIKAEQH